MLIQPEIYLKAQIKKYYEEHFIEIENIEQREFGYGVFGKKIATRHIGFKNNAALNDFLRNKVPFFVSYSVGYYKKPKATPMQKKEMIKADLLFEFDADDLPTECKKEHDSWKCKKCGAEGKGNVKKCPKCNGPVEIEEWICDKCLEATKKQTKALIKILINDFGFEKKDLELKFSGHKGYHIKIKSEKIWNLDNKERIEIMDYISEEGINYKALGFIPKEDGTLKFLGLRQGKGYDLLKKVYATLKSIDKENAYKWFSSPIVKKRFLENKEKILSEIKKGVLPKLRQQNAHEVWYELFDKIRETRRLYIDRQTTIDIHKIVRAENTIHGGAMLIAKPISINKLDSFMPFEHASFVGKEKVEIYLKKVPSIILNGKKIGPYENEVVTLPKYLACYFLAKGVSNGIIL